MLLIPFEMAILDGHARSVMHSYAEIDGVPVAADPGLLTGVLRDRWGFDGTRRRRLLRGGVPATCCTTSRATSATPRSRR